MQKDCVRSCRHPWFGGTGTCIVAADGTASCTCDAGFSTTDIIGQPSCEPKSTRRACHIAGCLLSAACLIVATKKLYSRIPRVASKNASFASSPRGGAGGGTAASSLGMYARPRIVCVVLVFSILWSTIVFSFHVVAWRTRASLQTSLFLMMMAAIACGNVAAVSTLRLWLFVLPSRLMQKTSISGFLRSWSDDRHGLPCLSVSYASWLLAVGVVGRSNILRGRALLLASTVPMASFFVLVVVSVSLKLSKAIQDSEKSAPLKLASSPSGARSSPRMATCNVRHLWAGCAPRIRTRGRYLNMKVAAGFGDGAGQGGPGDGNGTGGESREQPKISSSSRGYGKTKSMLKRLTAASVVVLAMVLTMVVWSLREGSIANDTPLIFFVALFTTVPSIWLMVAMHFLARDSSKSSPATAPTATVRPAQFPPRSGNSKKTSPSNANQAHPTNRHSPDDGG